MKEYQHLQDMSTGTGKIRPWKEKKIAATKLSESYKRLGDDKRSDVVRFCGSYLEFIEFSDGHKDLKSAHFCRQRLCPMCSWRKSLKTFANLSKVLSAIKKQGGYKFLFLTLTIKNVDEVDLGKGIDDLLKGWKGLMQHRRFRKTVIGTFRTLEITHNLDISSPNFDTWHPHLHNILVVRDSYNASDKSYITNAEWIHLWKVSAKLDYDPNIGIETIYSRGSEKMASKGSVEGFGIEGAVAEVSKYVSKGSAVIIPGVHLDNDLGDIEKRSDYELELLRRNMTDKSVWLLTEVLYGRRLTSMSGIIRTVSRDLNLDDVEDGDLVHIDGKPATMDDGRIVRYLFNPRMMDYCLCNAGLEYETKEI